MSVTANKFNKCLIRKVPVRCTCGILWAAFCNFAIICYLFSKHEKNPSVSADLGKLGFVRFSGPWASLFQWLEENSIVGEK